MQALTTLAELSGDDAFSVLEGRASINKKKITAVKKAEIVQGGFLFGSSCSAAWRLQRS